MTTSTTTATEPLTMGTPWMLALGTSGTIDSGFDSVVVRVEMGAGSTGRLWVDSLSFGRVAAGEPTCVLFREGTYDETCLVVPASGASEEAPIVLRPHREESVIFEPPAEFECPHLMTGSIARKFETAIFRVSGKRHIAFEDLVFHPQGRVALQLGVLDPAPRYVDAIRVAGCAFDTELSGGAHVGAHGLRSSEIVDNDFRGNTTGLLFHYGLPTSGNLIADNRFVGVPGITNTLALLGNGLSARSDEMRTTVRNNTFENAQGGIGSWLSYAEYSNNTFNNIVHGLNLSGQQLVAQNNEISDCASGFLLNSSARVRPYGSMSASARSARCPGVAP